MTVGGAIVLGPLAMFCLPIEFFTAVAYAIDILWAAPAAFLSARIAKENGLDAGIYARKGAWYSVLSIGLWIYLANRMEGRHMRERAIRIGYIALFTAWLCTSAVPSFLLFVLLMMSSVAGMALMMTFLWTIISAIIWYITLNKLMYFSYPRLPDNSDDGISPGREYIRPFVLSKACFIVTLGVVAGAILSM